MHSEIFLREFARLSSGLGGIQKLRDLVLQLALSGQLTRDLEQKPRWRLARVDEVVECYTGNSISASEKAQKFEGRNEGRPYIATKDVEGWHGGIRYENGIKIPEGEGRFKVAPKGSVLICGEGGSAGRKIGLLDRDVNFGNKLICSVPVRSNILQAYLFRVFQSLSFQKSFKREMTGIIGGISLAKFKRLQIPVPRLAIQEEIVSRINYFSKICDDLEVLRQKELELKRTAAASALHHLAEAKTPKETLNAFSSIASRFDDMFDDAKNIEELRNTILDLAYCGAFCKEKSKIVSLKDMLSFGPRNGYSPKPATLETDTKSITLSAITKGKFDHTKFKYINEEIGKDSHLWLRSEDILIQRANSIDYVGVSAIYYGSDTEFIYPDLIMKIRISENIIPEYVVYCLQSPSVRRYFQSNATGTSGSMPKINQAIVKAAPIPSLSRKAQEATIEAVRGLMVLCDLLEERVREDERLNAELMASLVNALTETGPDDGGPAVEATGLADTTTGFVAPDAASDDGGEQSGSDSFGTMRILESRGPASTAGASDVDTKFKEAVLVGAIVKAFFETGGEPIGNFRLQKAVYFARRHNGEHVGQMEYLKKAAGPYNPSMKYSGGIAIAKQKKWLHEARGRFGFGHVLGPAASEMDEWIAKYGYGDPARWVAEQFRFKKNEEWESIATVDYAMEHLQSTGIEVDAGQILQYIRADDEWRPKLEKLGLTEMSVATAMLEAQALFGTKGGDGSV